MRRGEVQRSRQNRFGIESLVDGQRFGVNGLSSRNGQDWRGTDETERAVRNMMRVAGQMIVADCLLMRAGGVPVVLVQGVVDRADKVHRRQPEGQRPLEVPYIATHAHEHTRNEKRFSTN